MLERDRPLRDTGTLTDDIHTTMELLSTQINETKDLIQELVWDTRDWLNKLNIGSESFAESSREFVNQTKDKITTVKEKDERRREIMRVMRKEEKDKKKKSR